MPSYDDDRFPPYVSAAERRHRAAQLTTRLTRSGRTLQPVETEGQGRRIATTFWGRSWCANLENYSDFANRLPRGRTYVRHGSVIDLRIDRGRVRALVSGTRVYEVLITIKPIAGRKWKALRSQCAGQLHSIVELLQGSISEHVMEVVTRQGEGLFPAPRDISLRCSCPDWATMCKHVAAVLYGVGVRLDHAPEMLFTLRGVDAAELIDTAVIAVPTSRASGGRQRLKADEVSSVFGIELAPAPPRSPAKKQTRPKKPNASSKKRAPAKAAGAKTTKASATSARGSSSAAKNTAKKKAKKAKLAVSKRMKAVWKKRSQRSKKRDS